MKKILNLITISTLTTVIPNPLLSNISLIERLKQDVRISNSNNEYVPLRNISGFGKAVQEVIFDSKDNIYFCIKTIFDSKNGIYKLSVGSDTPIKINNSYGVISISIDNSNNLYFGTDNGLYKLSSGSDTPTKINGVGDRILSTVIDNSNNLYFGKTNGLYKLQTALSWIKEQSQFNLIDSTAKKTWTRNDLITVDGELNIEIQNNNIDKVLFDNVQQTTTKDIFRN